jgi:hypothetical protein
MRNGDSSSPVRPLRMRDRFLSERLLQERAVRSGQEERKVIHLTPRMAGKSQMYMVWNQFEKDGLVNLQGMWKIKERKAK